MLFKNSMFSGEVKLKAIRDDLRDTDKVTRYCDKVYRSSRDRGFYTFHPPAWVTVCEVKLLLLSLWN